MQQLLYFQVHDQKNFDKLRQITRPRLAIQKIYDIRPIFGVEE